MWKDLKFFLFAVLNECGKNTEVQVKNKSQMHDTLNSLTFPHTIYIQGVSGGIVNILRGDNMDYSE